MAVTGSHYLVTPPNSNKWQPDLKQEEQWNGLESTGTLSRVDNCVIINGCKVPLSINADEDKESVEVRSHLLLFVVCDHKVNHEANNAFLSQDDKGAEQLYNCI